MTKVITESAARQRIINTALTLFYAEGIRATGIDRIIKQAEVTKVTFYRHFPSKNDLILAFLAARHQQWMQWFTTELAQQMQQQGSIWLALPLCLDKWFSDPQYRGCAFINSAVEIAELLPQSLEIAQQHKQQMTEVIAQYLPENPQQQRWASMIAMVVDGAMVKVQIEQSATQAVARLGELLALLQSSQNAI